MGTWFAEPLSAITVERLELWKGRRLSGGCKPITLLRDLFTLSSVLTRAVRRGKLATNPIRKSQGRVFNVSLSFKTAWWHLLERADIQNYRWHDLRHHFISRLVQAGVPLNTVRDLLGHSSVAMSLR